MSEQNAARAWIVRAGANGEAEQANLSLGRASIGWGEVPDLSTVGSRDELRAIVAELSPDASVHQIGQTTGQIWTFRDSIKAGDLIVMPLKSEPGRIAFGRCTGEYGYDPEAPEVSKHYLPVRWGDHRVPRERIQADVQAIINGAMTVFGAENYDAVARLARVADGEEDPGFGGVSDGVNEPVRHGLLIRAALEVLAEVSAPLPRSEVLRRVAPLLDFTDYEAEQASDDGGPRWEIHLSWASTDMKAAGWIEKTNAGWLITGLGRQELAGADPAGTELRAKASNAYREKHQAARGQRTGHYIPVLEAALEFIEPGQWTSYSDLASVANTNAQTVGWFTSNTEREGAHRVLGKGGRPSTGFEWHDGRKGGQREALEAEGISFEDGGLANQEQHLRSEDFRAFLEEQGIIQQLPKRAWLVRGSSVDGHDLVPHWLARGFASLRANTLRELEPGIARAELKTILDEDYSQASYAAKAAKLDEFHAFLSRMQAGDIIATTREGHLHLGVIAGEVEYVNSPDGLSNLRRPVVWRAAGVDYTELPSEVRARLQVQHDVVELTQQLDLLEKLGSRIFLEADQPQEQLSRELVLPDATDVLAHDLNVSREWLQECIDLLRDRPQMIFYGPPGTGKTYIAKHLAEHVAGDNVRLTQFHPAYSYEDFFEGYRPLEDGGFALKPGPLRKTVDAARENPSTPYFLIIDEINRGNLAKIFGELYFLLEYRDENVDLLYATDDDIGFTLPPNVFIIGTMNTSDRSIALVDAAMRRRFAFVPLHPSEPPTAGVLRRWLAKEGHGPEAADLLDELNLRIDDPDFRIGPSYFMRPAVHEDRGFDRAWRTAILPLLEEHHYGEGFDVRRHYGLESIRAVVSARRAPEKTRTDEPIDPA